MGRERERERESERGGGGCDSAYCSEQKSGPKMMIQHTAYPQPVPTLLSPLCFKFKYPPS